MDLLLSYFRNGRYKLGQLVIDLLGTRCRLVYIARIARRLYVKFEIHLAKIEGNVIK